MWVRFPPSAPIFILTFPRISVTITASFCVYPPVAQLVEQLPLKEMVAGSNPAGRTRISAMASLVTDLKALQCVVGSSPLYLFRLKLWARI